MRISTLISIYTVLFAFLKVYTKFENTGSNRSCEISIGEKEKWTNKGTDKQYVAVLLLHNTTHHYQALYQISESLLKWLLRNLWQKKNVHMYYIREKEGKNENLKKEGKMRIRILISIYTVHFAILKMYTKFENTGSNRSWEICDRNFHWRERKLNK